MSEFTKRDAALSLLAFNQPMTGPLAISLCLNTARMILPHRPEPKMLWLDIETTGLDANEDMILEVAFVLTDEWGNVIDMLCAPVINDGWEERLEGESFVNEMHTKSGLKEALQDLPPERVAGSRPNVVDQTIAEWIDQAAPNLKNTPIAGSSVRFDLDFMKVHMPEVAKRLHHYRVIDVSSLIGIASAHEVDIFEGLEVLVPDDEHRAPADIMNTIHLYRHALINILPTIGNGELL